MRGFRGCGCVSVVLMLALAGCGAAGKHSMNVPSSSGGDFDPFAYGDEFTTRKRTESDDMSHGVDSGSGLQGVNDTGVGDSRQDTMRRIPERDEAVDRSVYGYRVQIGIDRDKDRMETLAQKARKRLDVPVYIEYAAPFYRVRVGNYENRDDAERYVREYKSKGFRDALSVMSEISANEAIQ